MNRLIEFRYYDVIIGIIYNSNLFLLFDCISSVISETKKKYLIVVVDNISGTKDSKILKEKFSNIEIIINNKSKGFAENMNILINKYSHKADYFLMLNDDAKIMERAIDKLIDFLEQYDDVAAVSPKILFPNLKPQLSAGFFNIKKELWRYSGLGKLIIPKMKYIIGKSFEKYFSNKFSLKSYLRNFYENQKPWIASYISGTCMLMRYRTIFLVGGLSEDYYIYTEDVDWCRQVISKGWRVMVLPTATVIHHQESSSNIKSIVERERSSLIYFNKYKSNNGSVLFYRISMIMLTAFKIVLSPIIMNHGLNFIDRLKVYANIIRIMIKNEIKR